MPGAGGLYRAWRDGYTFPFLYHRTFFRGAAHVPLCPASSTSRKSAPHMAHHGRGGLHRVQPAANAAGARAAGGGARQFHDRPSAQPRHGGKAVHAGPVGTFPLHPRGHPRSRNLPPGLRGRGPRAARGGARLRAPLHRRSPAHQQLQHRRLPQHAGGRPRQDVYKRQGRVLYS